MLKPSKALISSGGIINYWWTYAPSTPISPCSKSSSRRQRKSAQSIGSCSARRHMSSLESLCQQSSPFQSRTSDSPYHSRRAHTSSHLPSSTDASSESYWPRLPLHKKPTPYDILSQSPNEPYNKRRFTYLVKLYHPDSHRNKSESAPTQSRNSSIHPSNLPTSIRIQRYHLLVQAHTILSDPSKRAAYDQLGAGWTSTPSLSDLRREDSPRGWAAAREYRHETPHHCATWEDWEEWWAREAARRRREDAGIFAHDFARSSRSKSSNYAHDAAERNAWWVSWVHSRRFHQGTNWHPTKDERQEPLYISNGFFILLIAVCTVTGAMYEFSRAGASSNSFMAQLERVNTANHHDLDRRRTESRLYDSKAHRVGKFLKDRSEDGVFRESIAERGRSPLLLLPGIPAPAASSSSSSSKSKG